MIVTSAHKFSRISGSKSPTDYRWSTPNSKATKSTTKFVTNMTGAARLVYGSVSTSQRVVPTYVAEFIGVTLVAKARLQIKGAIIMIGVKPKAEPTEINRDKGHYTIGRG
ncbi:hypothetical protein [Streptococcus sobrinus]|uniref:hypothetical protein n=1 Tax=Streptococcus sobrinus TaxID=1310 RepID=UPI00037DB830|nr:hypothetical protein [Streptococcus sobrinus]